MPLGGVMILRLLLLGLVLGASFPVFAFELDDEASVELLVTDKAQQRLYPGGRDEQDLQVQPSLPTPSRTLERFTLIETPDSEAPPAAND